MIVNVVSTGCRTPQEARARHEASIASQEGVDVQHFLHDAGEDGRAHFESLIDWIQWMPDDMIVASVDLDDWLATPHALARIAEEHRKGALVTYGNYQFADGRPSHVDRGYLPGEDIRRAPWRASHLKTFRAGLFKKIMPSDSFRWNGEWLAHARDLALMFPLLELAGHDRATFIAETLYVYNYASSTEFVGPESVRDLERRCVAHVRGLPPYRRAA